MVITSSPLDIKINLEQHCRHKSIGSVIYSYENCASTNSDALALARDKAVHGTMVTTLRQSAGRGRLGSSWQGGTGNIAFSVILRPKIKVSSAFRITFIASVAVAHALREFGLEPQIKWPNDLLLFDKSGKRKKICGILTESLCKGDDLEAAVLGIGINVLDSPDDSDFTISAGHLTQWVDIEAVALLKTIIDRLDDSLPAIEDHKLFARILDDYRAMCCTLGEEVVTGKLAVLPLGIAKEIRSDGSLLVQLPNGSTQIVYSAG